MDAKKLEILMTAVDLGSFSKASEVVGYTQSGLTHLVDSLEREIGFPLIRRSYSGIALTEAGENLLPDIRQFLQANATLENKIQAVREQQEEGTRRGSERSVWRHMRASRCTGCRRFYTGSAASARRWTLISAWSIMRWNHLNYYRAERRMSFLRADRKNRNASGFRCIMNFCMRFCQSSIP